MAITAAQVKELREMTGAGMMDCKKALTATEGDMDKAVEFLREKGLATAQKKANRVAAEGLCKTLVAEDGKSAVVVEVNSETDFVAKNEKFQQYVADVAAQALTTTAAIYGLAGLRIVLCMMPQNAWLSADSPLSWGIYRNIPFALMGLIIIVLFYKSAKENNDKSFRWMWLTIVLSFAFYIPVVLWADVIPMIGMLMIPKTCAYVWTVLIGYKAMKKEIA